MIKKYALVVGSPRGVDIEVEERGWEGSLEDAVDIRTLILGKVSRLNNTVCIEVSVPEHLPLPIDTHFKVVSTQSLCKKTTKAK